MISVEQHGLRLSPSQLKSPTNAKDLYLDLAKGGPSPAERARAQNYLHAQIAAVQHLPSDLPRQVDGLVDWMENHTASVGEAYRRYLVERKNGAPRRFFTNKSHALFFLKSVAPTKLADGSWLYGLLEQWADPRYRELIRTYLEELGDGIGSKNHVVLYEMLISIHDCQHWDQLSEAHFVQGAIQFALAYNAAYFLPEIIGYNLGYEQLPLHLLITAYELNELGIDPYYFTLHVTVDNADTGHARKAVQSLKKLMPQIDDGGEFYQRVMDGYRLNDLGANTNSVIASFNLQAELVSILQTRAVLGKNMHSDYCRVAGRTVNDWLSSAEQIPAFLVALQNAGWIQRGEPVEHSRLWRLIQSERAEMFGVFNEYEQQTLRDWISTPAEGAPAIAPTARILGFRALQRRAEIQGQEEDESRSFGKSRGLLRHHREDASATLFNLDLRELEHRLAGLGSKNDMMSALIELMTPDRHHGSAGLMATRIFTRLYG